MVFFEHSNSKGNSNAIEFNCDIFGAFLTLLFMRPIAQKIGLVDKPNFRKRHQGAIPLIGGVSLFVGNLCFYLLEWEQMRLPTLYLFSIFVLLVIGMIDDRFDISPFCVPVFKQY